MIPEEAHQIPFVDFPQFIGLTTSLSPRKWIYRGEANSEWVLRPKAGRDEFYREFPAHLDPADYPPQNHDLRHFERWVHEAIAYDPAVPKYGLESLAHAQHHGLATRLLDWSRNPLVALYFAVEAHDAKDAVVYAYYTGGMASLQPDEDLTSPVGIRFYVPRPFSRRISAQQGVFTYHSHPREPFKPAVGKTLVPLAGAEQPDVPDVPFSDLVAVTIPSIHKYGLVRKLRDVGITRNTLFPDLEGLSQFINWEALEEKRIDEVAHENRKHEEDAT